MKLSYKVGWFVTLLMVFLVVGGSDLNLRIMTRYLIIYILGASTAFWAAREPIGTLRPISMRPLAILLGVAMMVYSFVMLVLVKEALHHHALGWAT